MRVGWIGLGKMGAPMAVHVAGAFPLLAHDRDPARVHVVPRATAATTEDLARADVVVTSLPDDEALEAVGAELVPHLRSETILVETSTVSPQASARLRARGHLLTLASPVSGSTAIAQAAALTLFCSGPAEALERARPVLARFARNIYHVGDGEEARYLKLALNHFLGSTAQIAAEALTLARRGGVAWDVMLEVLAASPAASPLIAHKLEPLRRRDFSPAFTIAQMARDMGLTADAAGPDAPIAALVRDAYRRQAGGGLAELDFFAAVLEAERRAGLGEPD
ncbi:MAG: NAD(P)-dependent oxidoreductase [Acetobacteraceae bacterium]|nr:NAD(P)-dependent oxidoreductase [Acetobacteraceae bacterium]